MQDLVCDQYVQIFICTSIASLTSATAPLFTCVSSLASLRWALVSRGQTQCSLIVSASTAVLPDCVRLYFVLHVHVYDHSKYEGLASLV